eukprot:1148435-Pelagomonas_calceolata.AAC.7
MELLLNKTKGNRGTAQRMVPPPKLHAFAKPTTSMRQDQSRAAVLIRCDKSGAAVCSSLLARGLEHLKRKAAQAQLNRSCTCQKCTQPQD